MKNYDDVTMQKGNKIIKFMFVFGYNGDMDIWEYEPKHYSERRLVTDFDKRYHELLNENYVEV